MTEQKSSLKEQLLSPLMLWFLFAMILANIAGTMTNLLMPIYLTELGASVGQVGLVFTLTSVVILALQVLGGWISDNIGRLRAIAIGSIGGVIGFFLILISPTWQWMLVSLAISMIPYALVGPSFGAFIAENSSEANRGRVYGLTGTIYQVTGIIGPPLGGLLAAQFGFKPMLLVAAIFYSMAAGLRIWMARTMKSAGERAPRPLTGASFKSSLLLIWSMVIAGGVITWLFITDGVHDTAFRLSEQLQPLYLQQIGGLTLAQIGLLGSFYSAAMMVTPLLSGRLADRHGERLPISAGFLLISGSIAMFLVAESYPAFILVWVLAGCGEGLLSPAYQSLISKIVPSESLGAFNGMFYGSIGFIALPAPWIGAQLWEKYNPRLPFAITMIACFISVIPIWLKFKVPKNATAPSMEETAA